MIFFPFQNDEDKKIKDFPSDHYVAMILTNNENFWYSTSTNYRRSLSDSTLGRPRSENANIGHFI